MFHNYLVTALRNLARNRLSSFINIGGLALGLTCTIFILLYIQDELSYDKWIPGAQNLYRIEKIYYGQGRDPFGMALVPFPMPAAMHDEIPEVAAMTRIGYAYMTLSAGDRQFREHVAAVEPNFFAIIKLPLTQGDPDTVFQDPQSLVLSESAARKYFGTADAVGKVLSIAANCAPADDITACRRRLVPLKVTGIMRDIPHNSHLDGEVFMPNTSIAVSFDKQSWFGGAGYGYVALAPGARPETIVSKTAALLDRAIPNDPADPRKGSQRYAIHLTPFADVHLTSSRWSINEKPGGSLTALYGVGLVGILILLVACFNFMNLATALASLRAREIGLRKILGARRGQLVVQFLGEAVLTALLSLGVALILVEILQPAFSRMLQRPVAIHYAGDWPFLLVFIAVMAGIVGGLYPALVLSGFRPATILRAGSAARTGSGFLQTALVVLQFAVSIGLGIAVLVVFNQISFARNLDLGFRKDNLLVINGNALLTIGGQESFVQRLRSDPGILGVATTNAVPFGTYSVGLSTGQMPGRPDTVALNRLIIGPDALQLLGVRLAAGRFLSGERAQDQFDTKNSAAAANAGHNILIDETAAASLGFTPEQAVGKIILLGPDHVQIAGVVADVKFDGAREPAKAVAYVYDPHQPASVLVRLRPGAIPQTLSFIDRAWHDFAPAKAVTHDFMDASYGRLYQSEERQGEMFGVFVVVAVFISALGLFGLAAFTANRRTREIGIRKVFGARGRDIIFLLLWQFSLPVLIANAVAWPLAWYYLHGWLEGFAYRISLGPLYFLGAGAIAMAIAWLTVFTHALRVAGANPIHALRYE